jgi:hypothetical protein
MKRKKPKYSWLVIDDGTLIHVCHVDDIEEDFEILEKFVEFDDAQDYVDMLQEVNEYCDFS